MKHEKQFKQTALSKSAKLWLGTLLLLIATLLPQGAWAANHYDAGYGSWTSTHDADGVKFKITALRMYNYNGNNSQFRSNPEVNVVAEGKTHTFYLGSLTGNTGKDTFYYNGEGNENPYKGSGSFSKVTYDQTQNDIRVKAYFNNQKNDQKVTTNPDKNYKDNGDGSSKWCTADLTIEIYAHTCTKVTIAGNWGDYSDGINKTESYSWTFNLGHSLANVQTTPATCAETGLRKSTCSCGAVTEEVLPKDPNAHNYDKDGLCTNQLMDYQAPEGQGTKDSPYLVKNIGNLYWLSDQVYIYKRETFHARQVCDITASDSYDYAVSIGCRQGNSVYTFRGTYDGGGYVIKNLKSRDYWVRSDYEEGLLFGRIEGATIKNVGIVGAEYKEIWDQIPKHFGVLCGYAKNSTISNCFVLNTDYQIEATYGSAAICGYCDASTITNCYTNDEKAMIAEIGSKSTLTGCYGRYRGITNTAYTRSSIIDYHVISANDVSSGALCYTMNGEQTNGTQTWYQKLGTNAEVYPTPKKDVSKTVYKIANLMCDGKTANGSYTYTNDKNAKFVDAHNFASSFTTDKEVTCVQEGSKSKHCSVCDAKTEVTTISALNHSMIEHAAKLATCSEDGNLLYYTCSRACCSGKYYKDCGAHTANAYANQAATGTSMLSHIMAEHAAHDANCTDDGNLLYYTCSQPCCSGKYYKDNVAHTTNAYADLAETVVTAAGHHYEDGTCTVCDYSVYDEVTYLDANGKQQTAKAIKLTADMEGDYMTTDQWGYYLASGWYYVEGELNLNNYLYLQDGNEVNIILADGCVWNEDRGISAYNNTTLNIYCQSQKTGTVNLMEKNDAVDVSEGGTINIYGGTFANTNPEYDLFYVEDGGNLNFYDANVRGLVTLDGGHITLYGGTFTNSSYSAFLYNTEKTSGNPFQLGEGKAFYDSEGKAVELYFVAASDWHFSTLTTYIVRKAPALPVEVPYLDASGKQQTAKAIKLTADMEGDYVTTDKWGYYLASGWYYVEGELNLNNYLYLRDGNEVNIILADGCVWNEDRGISAYNNTTLNIYCQSQKTGTVNLMEKTDAVSVSEGGTINIYGGTFANTNPEYDLFCVEDGGNLNFYDANVRGLVTLYGGHITLFGGTFTNSSYRVFRYAPEKTSSNPFQLGEGKAFYDSEGNAVELYFVAAPDWHVSTLETYIVRKAPALPVEVPYLDANGKEQTAIAIKLTADMEGDYVTTDELGNYYLAPGWYYVEGELNLINYLYLMGDDEEVNIILADGCQWTLNNDITVDDGVSLNIYCQSQKTGTVAMGKYSLNINDGGEITINGGNFKSNNDVALNLNAYATTTINGGSFSGNQFAVFADARTKVIINGGAFKGRYTAALGYQIFGNNVPYQLGAGKECYNADTNLKENLAFILHNSSRMISTLKAYTVRGSKNTFPDINGDGEVNVADIVHYISLGSEAPLFGYQSREQVLKMLQDKVLGIE